MGASEMGKRRKDLVSFKFNGNPVNRTMSFKMEMPYDNYMEGRHEMRIKLKGRVDPASNEKNKTFIRKSCVKFPFPPGDDDDDDDDSMNKNDGSGSYPPVNYGSMPSGDHGYGSYHPPGDHGYGSYPSANNGYGSYPSANNGYKL